MNALADEDSEMFIPLLLTIPAGLVLGYALAVVKYFQSAAAVYNR